MLPASPPQEYIENENSRLEREHQFWAKEIIVRMEYKYCPNLSIIDTPGEALAAVEADQQSCRTHLGPRCLQMLVGTLASQCCRLCLHRRPHLSSAGQAQWAAAGQRAPGAPNSW